MFIYPHHQLNSVSTLWRTRCARVFSRHRIPAFWDLPAMKSGFAYLGSPLRRSFVAVVKGSLEVVMLTWALSAGRLCYLGHSFGVEFRQTVVFWKKLLSHSDSVESFRFLENEAGDPCKTYEFLKSGFHPGGVCRYCCCCCCWNIYSWVSSWVD